MCDVCGKDGFSSFDERKVEIKNIIEEAQADLLSLQEIRTESQLKEFFQNKPNYELIYWNNIISYADPALAINTNRFSVKDSGHFWFGPNTGEFTFGWKLALPRMAQWVKLMDLKTKQEFIFIGAHFDNRVENMIGSAQMVQDFISKQSLPIIFAADTNSTPDFEGYKILTSKNLQNSFDLHKETRSIAQENSSSLCYLRKGSIFPDCRVDHILFSKNSPWEITSWNINTSKGQLKNFPSDHRPIMATFNYLIFQ
jgi:endonuclease/exonuclease/phosphatase family metal-dependent hydrolase